MEAIATPSQPDSQIISIQIDAAAARVIRGLHVINDAKTTSLQRVNTTSGYTSMKADEFVSILISAHLSVDNVVYSFAKLCDIEPAEVGLAEWPPALRRPWRHPFRPAEAVEAWGCDAEERQEYVTWIRFRLDIEPQVHRLRQIDRLQLDLRGHMFWVLQLKADFEVIRWQKEDVEKMKSYCRPEKRWDDEAIAARLEMPRYGGVEEALTEGKRTEGEIEKLKKQMPSLRQEAVALFQFVMSRPYTRVGSKLGSAQGQEAPAQNAAASAA